MPLQGLKVDVSGGAAKSTRQKPGQYARKAREPTPTDPRARKFAYATPKCQFWALLPCKS